MPKYKVQVTVEQNAILTVEADNIDAAKALVVNESKFGLGNIKAIVTISDAWECTFDQWKMDEMFSDLKRHAFYSVFDADEAEDRRGPRGGKVRGRKTVCAHCGCRADKHVHVDR